MLHGVDMRYCTVRAQAPTTAGILPVRAMFFPA